MLWSLLLLPCASALTVANSYINSSSTDFSPVHVKVDLQDTSRRNKTAPQLYGLMHEDISHSGDGGIYAELLRNRAFQGNPISAGGDGIEPPWAPVLDGWAPIGNVSLSLDRTRPLSWALPVSMQLVVPVNTTGEVGVQNFGFWGMDVQPGDYEFSVYLLALNNTYPTNATTTMTASLRSNATGETWASEEITAHLPTFRFCQFNATISNNATAPDGNNTFALTMRGEDVSGLTLNLAMFSLFPETFKGRKNGLRKDIAEALYDMKPQFLRAPGGNNLEGPSLDQRFKWWETLGPLSERPGRVGDWGYYNTGGLGLMEYLEWAEDMDMEVVLAVYAGYSLDGTSYPEENMDEVLQEAIEEIEFVIGDCSTTKWGKKRAELGHPDPFPLTYVEIGNEDFFSPTYHYRFPYMYDGLSKAYPNLTFISTAYNESYGKMVGNITIPDGALYDRHNYDKPSTFVSWFDEYDNYLDNPGLEGAKIFLGEYSVFQLDTDANVDYTDPVGIHIFYPQMIAALGESVYLLGAERNPNVVSLSSYAPLLQHRNSTQWTPNLISFEAQHNKTVLSASYWWQHLFGNHRGCETLPTDVQLGNINPLFFGSTMTTEGDVLFKLINTGNQTVDFALTLDSSYSQVNATTLQNDNPNAFNYVYNQTEVVPRAVNASMLPQQTSSSNGTWTWTVPMFSITVFQFQK